LKQVKQVKQVEASEAGQVIKVKWKYFNLREKKIIEKAKRYDKREFYDHSFNSSSLYIYIFDSFFLYVRSKEGR
jgi:hypothetical protein